MAGNQFMRRSRFRSAVPSTLTVVVVFFMPLLLLSRQARAQSIRFSFPDGEPMWTDDGVARPPDASAFMIGLVQDKVIQKEIEFVESQSRELEKIIEDHTRDRRKLFNAMQRKPFTDRVDPSKGELNRRIRELNGRTLDRIDVVLVPHQADRLKSVVFWIQASQKGLSFVADDIAEQMGVSLTGAERQSIHQAQNQLDGELIDHCLREYRSLISRTAEAYPAYRDILQQFDKSASPIFVDVLLASIEEIDQLSPELLDAQLSGLVREVRTITSSANGNLVVIQKEQPAFMDLMNLLFYKGGDSAVLINQEQKMDFGRLVGDLYVPHSFKLQKEMEANIARGMELAEAARQFNDEMDRIDRESIRRFQEEILLPAQIEWLSQAFREKKRKSFGVAGVLLMDTSNDGTPITTEEHAKVREFLKKEIEALRDNIARQFHDTVQRQVSRFPDSIRGETGRLLNDPPKYLLPSLSLLANSRPREP